MQWASRDACSVRARPTPLSDEAGEIIRWNVLKIWAPPHQHPECRLMSGTRHAAMDLACVPIDTRCVSAVEVGLRQKRQAKGDKENGRDERPKGPPKAARPVMLNICHRAPNCLLFAASACSDLDVVPPKRRSRSTPF